MGQSLEMIALANVRALLAHRWPGANSYDLEKLTGIGKSTFARILDTRAEAIPPTMRLETIEMISKKCPIDPWKLFIEGFDPAAPPLLSGESEQVRARMAQISARVEQAKVFLGESPDQKIVPLVTTREDDTSIKRTRASHKLKPAPDYGDLAVPQFKKPGPAGSPARHAPKVRSK